MFLAPIWSMINGSYQKISDDRLMKCFDYSGMIIDSFRRLGFVTSDSFFFLSAWTLFLPPDGKCIVPPSMLTSISVRWCCYCSLLSHIGWWSPKVTINHQRAVTPSLILCSCIGVFLWSRVSHKQILCSLSNILCLFIYFNLFISILFCESYFPYYNII